LAVAAQSASLSEEEFDRLEDLLASDIFSGEAMALDELQGFLCAIVSGPELIPPSEWRPAALGESVRYESEAQAQEVLALVMRFYNQIAQALEADKRFGFVLYRPDETAEYDYETWCLGYLDGVEFSPVAWEEAGDADEVDELLFPLVALAGELPTQSVTQMKPEELERLLTECRKDFGAIVSDIYRYWLAVRAKPTTIRRVEPKTGRNDPCPCGSGKKFKQCCGAPSKLH
jgi:uncharacterized protein